MAMTKTAKVARAIMACGTGTTMFNDKLSDGSRSLKVWGWDKPQYMMAKRMLEQQGCKVKLVTFHTNTWRGKRGMQTRLHVVE